MESLITCAKCHTEVSQEQLGNISWCKPCYNEWRRGWRKNNPDKVQGQERRALQRDPDRRHRYDKNSYLRNRDKRIAKSRLWNVNNKERFAAREAARRASRQMATPSWADEAAIHSVYRWAGLLSKQSGKKYEVDHIVPLKSDFVCGLHVQHNLQILPKSENVSKLNRRWPDMP